MSERETLFQVAELQRRLADALILLERFEFLPYGALTARRVIDGEWITDGEEAARIAHRPLPKTHPLAEIIGA